MLVRAALVLPGTQLGAVVLALALHVQTLLVVVAVRDPVAADAPEHLEVARLEFARGHAVTCTAPGQTAQSRNTKAQGRFYVKTARNKVLSHLYRNY